MESTVTVNGVRLWCRSLGEGDPVIQIHGCGFGHSNFDFLTPRLSEFHRVIDFDQRGYGLSDRPVQDYDMEVWADDIAGLQDALGISRSHIHGISMGGMVAIVFAGKYPERTASVVMASTAAKLGMQNRLLFKSWIDIVRMDPDGPGSRILAEMIGWLALSKEYLETREGIEAIDFIQNTLRDTNDPEVFARACQAMCDMDLTPWLEKIVSPALVLGGDEDGIELGWDQGPNGIGMNELLELVQGAEKHVLQGAHGTSFESAGPYAQTLVDFFARNPVEAHATSA